MAHDFPRNPTNDEHEALKSLDDTSFRTLPDAIWEPEPAAPPAEVAPRGLSPRVKTGILVSAVAVVSFVAGGVTARLSSQAPLLFAQEPAAREVTASFDQRLEPAHPVEEEAEPEVEAVPDDTPAYEDDSEDAGPDDLFELDHRQEQEVPEPQDKSTDWSWRYDDQDGNSVTYDPEHDQVNIDYYGYTLSVPVSDLWGDESSSDPWREQDTQQERTYDYRTESDNDLEGWSDELTTNNDYSWFM